MLLIIVLLLLFLIFAGVGFTAHLIWILAFVALIAAVVAFVIRR